MSRRDLRAHTVLGDPLRGDYALVLAHEHLLIDIRCWLDTDNPSGVIPDRVDSVADADQLRATNVFACPDNLLLNSLDTAIDELKEVSAFGHVLLIDVTPRTVGRNVVALQQISQATGVDIVCGCGPYIDASWPPDDQARTWESVRDELIEDVEAGTAAVIGEIGTSSPITEHERRALIGAAAAQRQTRAPLYVHLDPWAEEGHRVLDILEAYGADLGRTVLCHLDPHVRNGLPYPTSLLARGVLCGFDIWGDEAAYGRRCMPSDRDRARATADLITAGYGAQLVHSQDVCTKTQLRRFGGSGYAHLPVTGRAQMASAGLSEQQISDQLITNPLRLFDYPRS